MVWTIPRPVVTLGADVAQVARRVLEQVPRTVHVHEKVRDGVDSPGGIREPDTVEQQLEEQRREVLRSEQRGCEDQQSPRHHRKYAAGPLPLLLHEIGDATSDLGVRVAPLLHGSVQIVGTPCSLRGTNVVPRLHRGTGLPRLTHCSFEHRLRFARHEFYDVHHGELRMVQFLGQAVNAAAQPLHESVHRELWPRLDLLHAIRQLPGLVV
jgi:hypothetical protein